MPASVIHLVLAVWCSATPLATGLHAFALFKGRVTFTAPQSWGVTEVPASDSFAAILFCIPNPVSEGTADAANVMLVVRPAPTITSFRAYTDSQFAQATGRDIQLILTDTTEGDRVRTIFWRGQQGTTPYGIGDIFAVRGGLAIQIRSALPFLRGLPPDWLPRVSAELNAFLASVKVDGARVLSSVKTNPDSGR